MLRELPTLTDPNVLAGNAIAGDAGLYRLDGERALAVTLTVLSPIVDDPFTYGRIAAANALAKLYATGAGPLCAVAMAALPEDLEPSVVAAIFRGGAHACAEAGIPVVGGHTVKSAQPVYGFAVTGVVRQERIVREDAGRAGDLLILTKALGTGILTTARYNDAIGDEELEPAIESMIELDAAASDAALRHGVTAMGAVTDDGLIGLLARMLGPQLGARVDAGTVPLFPRALSLSAHDAVPSAARANLRSARAARTQFSRELPLGLAALLCDAQFSGGLLIAIPRDRAGALLDELQDRAPAARVIGTLTAERGIEVVWRPAKQ